MRKIISGAILLALFSAAILEAQTGQGSVTGEVTDPSGASLPGATITLKSEGTAVEQKEISRNDGNYRFALVPPGSYTLTVVAAGFAEEAIKKITVDPSL